MAKDTPILFTTENVRAILDGRKTQTRRLNGLKKFNRQPDRWRLEGSTFAFDGGFEYVPVPNCPYGQPGDRLWVRETWANPGEEGVLYRANPEDAALVERWKTDPNYPQVKWQPSIFMPKSACRLWLELTEVRMERLQDITYQDAIAEGVTIKPDAEIAARVADDSPARMEYWALWVSINGADSWARNPFVWVLSFKMVNV